MFKSWKRRLASAVVGVGILFFGYSLTAQTATPLEASGQVKYLSTNSTNSAFALTAGRTTAAPSDMFSLGPAYGKRFRETEVTFFGSGSATQTFSYRVWVVHRGFSSINGTQIDYEKSLYCSGTATLGSTAGVATSGGILTTDKMVDTLTVTLEAYGASSTAGKAGVSPQAYSPGSNGCARLFLPELGNASDIIIEFDMTGATSANCLIERGT